MTAKDVETPDAKTFDLIGALEGREYPEIEVPIFLNEGIMFTYAQLSEASAKDPANKEKQEALDAMFEEVKHLAITVTVRGTPRHIRKAIVDKVMKKHPVKSNAFGQEEDSPEGVEMLTQLSWEAHVVRVTAPDGTEMTPNKAEIQALRDKAPDASINAIADAISELSEGSRSGYEQIVQDPNFLSQPSPTE